MSDAAPMRVLLVDPIYKDPWEPRRRGRSRRVPGQAAVREVREELGLALPVGQLLGVDWVPLGPQPSDTLANESVMTGFDGGVLTTDQVAAIKLQREELRGWAFVPDDRLHERSWTTG